jgi:hypothetical protein
MSADLLRRAAKEMRERAEAATPGPYYVQPNDLIGGFMVRDEAEPPSTGHGRDVGDFMTVDDCRHIASWHPAVALAVADWLENEAELEEGWSAYEAVPQCVAVARAYLGEDPA